MVVPVHATEARETANAATSGVGNTFLRSGGCSPHTFAAGPSSHVACPIVHRLCIPLRNRGLTDASINDQLHFSMYAGRGWSGLNPRLETDSSADCRRGCSHAGGPVGIGHASSDQSRFASRARRRCCRATRRRAAVDSSGVPAAGGLHAVGRLPRRTHRSLALTTKNGTRSLNPVVRRAILSIKGCLNRVLGSSYTIVTPCFSAASPWAFCPLIGTSRNCVSFRNPVVITR